MNIIENLHPSQKEFFKEIYRDNEDRIVNKRELSKDILQWETNQGFFSKEKELSDLYAGENEYANYFIVGSPRTGSTLLSQILLQAFDLGCQYNAVAKYYSVPLYGYSEISEKLKEKNKLESFLGNTTGNLNAHEFGYFWQYWLNYTDHHEPTAEHLSTVAVNQLQHKLNAITNFLGKDLLIKNQVYINFIINWISNHITNSKFIFIYRDDFEVVESILYSRFIQYGRYDLWWSLRPAMYNEWSQLNPIDQVVNQVLYTNKKIRQQLSILDNKEYIIIRYSDIVNNMKETISEVGEFLNKRPKNLSELKEQLIIRKKDYQLPWDKDQVMERLEKIKKTYC